MARRGWVRSILLATLVAGATGAAQLGLGYGLGIVAWVPLDESAQAAWTAGLVWATFIAAISVVVGAVVGESAGGTVANGGLARLAARLAVVLAAALGALVVIPLVGVPASRAKIEDNFAPHLLAGVYTGLGVLIGLLVALLAVSVRAVAANVVASATWLWTLAIIALAHASTAGAPTGYQHLAVWRLSDGPMWGSYDVPGALVLLAASLLAGGLAAFPAAIRGAARLGVAVSGAAGPAIVALAYVLAAPQIGQAPPEQVSAAATAPVMVLAGLAGSLLTSFVARGPKRPRARPSARRARHDAATAIGDAAPASDTSAYDGTAMGSTAMGSAAAWADPGGWPLPPAPATVATGTARVPAASRLDPSAPL